jgi:phosphoribosylanthranilate isomerase
MMIKICGIFREQDIDYVNEARPDYCGFVFAESKRQVSAAQAACLRRRLAEGIMAAGVFVNAPIGEITALYRDGTINIAQLHGDEDEPYIAELKDVSAKSGKKPIPIIKVIKSEEFSSLLPTPYSPLPIDYYLLDSGSGSGETFDWGVLNSLEIDKPWFLAGGINLDNIGQAMAAKPFGIDISSGAETGGVKDREKILQLVAAVRKGNMV